MDFRVRVCLDSGVIVQGDICLEFFSGSIFVFFLLCRTCVFVVFLTFLFE